MTGWLLDTNVIDRLATGMDGRPKLEGRFTEWLGDNTDSLFLPAIIALEAVAGIEKLRRAGAVAGHPTSMLGSIASSLFMGNEFFHSMPRSRR
jgi:hypothetical protein